MRTLTLLLISSVLLAATPAMAGKVSYVDGQGRWVPSACEAPRAPAALPNQSDASAEDLNARMAAYNAYVTAAGAYMDCVGQEAQRDADTMSHMIVKSAQDIMSQTQTEIAQATPASKAK